MDSEEGIDIVALACSDSHCNFKPVRLQRRPLGPRDIRIETKYCGVCHTDLHVAANHTAGVTGATQYPCVPGHEIAGTCVAVGTGVTKISVGDNVGVGFYVDSCLDCKACKNNREQDCQYRTDTVNGKVFTHRAATFPAKRTTLGGYSTVMVVDERFAIKIPVSMPLQYAGPLMCAGVTMYSPLKEHGIGIGSRIGVIGLGGLGDMGIKLASALGAQVTAISRSYKNKERAIEFGASNFIATSDKEAFNSATGSLDLILNTIPVSHDWTMYQKLLSKGGKHILVGVHSAFAGAMIANKLKNASVKNALVGGIQTTQEVVDLCAEKQIYPQIELFPAQKLNDVYTALDQANDAGKRYVLNIKDTLNEDGQSQECCNVTLGASYPCDGCENSIPSMFRLQKNKIEAFEKFADYARNDSVVPPEIRVETELFRSMIEQMMKHQYGQQKCSSYNNSKFLTSQISDGRESSDKRADKERKT